MDLAAAVSKVILDQGVAITLLLLGGWFIVARLWPFYTKVYYPSVMERERQRDKDAATLANAMLELRAVVSQLVPIIAQVNTNTTEAFSEYRTAMNEAAHRNDSVQETVLEIWQDVKDIKTQINRDYREQKPRPAPAPAGPLQQLPGGKQKERKGYHDHRTVKPR